MKILDAILAASAIVAAARRASANDGKLDKNELFLIITAYLPQLLRAFGVDVPEIDGYTVANEYKPVSYRMHTQTAEYVI